MLSFPASAHLQLLAAASFASRGCKGAPSKEKTAAHCHLREEGYRHGQEALANATFARKPAAKADSSLAFGYPKPPAPLYIPACQFDVSRLCGIQFFLYRPSGIQAKPALTVTLMSYGRNNASWKINPFEADWPGTCLPLTSKANNYFSSM